MKSEIFCIIPQLVSLLLQRLEGRQNKTKTSQQEQEFNLKYWGCIKSSGVYNDSISE